MLRPWPRIRTDFHGSFFFHYRRASGETAALARSSTAGLPQFQWRVDSAEAGLRALIRDFVLLLIRAESYCRQQNPQNTSRSSCRETILGPTTLGSASALLLAMRPPWRSHKWILEIHAPVRCIRRKTLQ